MADDNITKIGLLIDQLLDLGEDREEMTFWKNVYTSLSETEQNELLQKLETELQTLKNLQ